MDDYEEQRDRERNAGFFERRWRERGIRHGWIKPTWAGPMYGTATAHVDGQTFILHGGDTLTVTKSPLVTLDVEIERPKAQ